MSMTTMDRCHCGELSWLRDGASWVCESCGCPMGATSCARTLVPLRAMPESAWLDIVREVNALWPSTTGPSWPPQTAAAGYQLLRAYEPEQVRAAIREIARSGREWVPAPGQVVEACRQQLQRQPIADEPPERPHNYREIPDTSLEEWLGRNESDPERVRRAAAIIRMGSKYEIPMRIRVQLAMHLLMGTRRWTRACWERRAATWLKVWIETKDGPAAFLAADQVRLELEPAAAGAPAEAEAEAEVQS